MSNELIVENVGVSKYADEKAFIAVTSANFLPRLQLMGGNSDAVKEGKIGIARWAILGRNSSIVSDLGPQTDVLVLSWRPKALEINKAAGTIISVFNPNLPEFKRIEGKSDTPNSGCMFGPEFLVWHPKENQFLTLFMGSKTARGEAPNVKTQMGRFATLKSKLIKTPQYSWHGPVCTMCSTEYNLPDKDELLEQVRKFNNPPENETEAAPEQAEGESRER